MRILYDHQVSSLQDAGGASRYHFELIRNLQNTEGLETELLLGLNGSVMPFASLRGSHTRVWSRSTAIKPGKVRYAANELLSALVAPLRGKFDIYHPTLYRALPWVRRRRLVVTHHDCIHERFPYLFPNAASIMAAKRKLFAQADAILCVSESSRNDLHKFYEISEKKTHVVHHGFSPLQLGPASGAIEEIVAGEGPYLLYVGSRAGYKNFDLLLEAFSRSGLAQHYRLLAVGGGAFTQQETARIASLRLAASVSLLSRANDHVLARAYRGATLFVYPSLYEGFGFPPLEAMSMGCPVLAHRTSSLPEICGEAALYFDPPTPEALAESLTSALADPDGLESKRALGRKQVSLYDWGKSARATLDVYRRVAT